MILQKFSLFHQNFYWNIENLFIQHKTLINCNELRQNKYLSFSLTTFLIYCGYLAAKLDLELLGGYFDPIKALEHLLNFLIFKIKYNSMHFLYYF